MADPQLESLLIGIRLQQLRLAQASADHREKLRRRREVLEEQWEIADTEVQRLEPLAIEDRVSDEGMVRLAMVWLARSHYAKEWREVTEAFAQLELVAEDEVTVRERATILDQRIIVE